MRAGRSHAMGFALVGLCAALALSFAGAAGCSGGQVAQVSTAIIVVQCPQSFTARVDDRPVPVLRAPTGAVVRVPAGRRRLTLEAAGYLPYLADVDLAGGETWELTVELWPVVPELDESFAQP